MQREQKQAELSEARGSGAQTLVTQLEAEIRNLSAKRLGVMSKLDEAKDKQQSAHRQREADRRRARMEILGDADVICTTLSGAGHEMLAGVAFDFETVVIDEAAQAVELSSMIPLRLFVIGNAEHLRRGDAIWESLVATAEQRGAVQPITVAMLQKGDRTLAKDAGGGAEKRAPPNDAAAAASPARPPAPPAAVGIKKEAARPPGPPPARPPVMQPARPQSGTQYAPPAVARWGQGPNGTTPSRPEEKKRKTIVTDAGVAPKKPRVNNANAGAASRPQPAPARPPPAHGCTGERLARRQTASAQRCAQTTRWQCKRQRTRARGAAQTTREPAQAVERGAQRAVCQEAAVSARRPTNSINTNTDPIFPRAFRF
ncbi:hypothetical protein L1887_60492 [Cichorium endivia]|nr:hypothetical protein L1887_60492 [Cichorium endivia]